MHAITLNNVSVTYPGDSVPALSIDSLHIPAGKISAILGKSGAGKSTLLSVVAGTSKIQSGTVQIFGRELHPSRLKSTVSLVYQNFNLINRMSVIDNVLIGRLSKRNFITGIWPVFSKSDRQASILALDRVGMVEFLDKDVRELSGGQKQRVAIARCLAQEAKIILADEPVASLDPFNANKILEILKGLTEDGITIVANLHQIKLAEEFCDVFIGLSKGNISFVSNKSSGNVEESQWRALYG